MYCCNKCNILFCTPRCVPHIVQAIRKETVKMQDEWEVGLASTSRLTPSSTPSSSAPSTTMDQSVSVPDAYCFELLSMVLALSGSRVGRSYVAQQDGLLLDLVSLLHTGTPRIQRQVSYYYFIYFLFPYYRLNLVQRRIMDMILFEVFLKNIHLIPQDQIVQWHYLLI